MTLISRLLAVNLREHLAHKVRAAVVVAIVGVSVALIVAVFGTYGSITGSVRELSQRTAGIADLEVSGITDTGFSQSLVESIRNLDGVAAAAPILRMQVPSTHGTLLLFGVDESIESMKSDLQEAVRDEVSDMALLANTVAVGPRLAQYVDTGFSIDDRPVDVTAALNSGLAHEINSGDFGVTSLTFGQEVTGRQGLVDSILVVLDPSANAAQVRSDIADVVSGQALVSGPEFRSTQAQAATALTRNSTLVVALIALVVASFLVFNAMNMAVAERRSSVATVRALGGRRAVLVRDLITESIVFALLGGIAGVPLGILLGRVAVDSLPPAMVQSFEARIHYVLPVYAVPVAIACGVLACVVATVAAAREVFTVSPLEALGSSKIPDAETANSRLAGLYLALGVVLVGASLIGIGLVRSQIVVIFAAVLVAGILALCSAGARIIAMACSAVLKQLPATGELAKETMDRSPRRAWATSMTVAIAIGVGMATSGSMNNLVSSVAASAAVESDPGLYVTSQQPDVFPTGPVLPPDAIETVRTSPRVTRVIPGQFAYMNWNDLRIILFGVSEGSRAALFAGLDADQKDTLLRGEGVVVSTQLAQRLGLRDGDGINLPSPSGTRTTRVIAAVDYVTLDPGALALPLWQMESWFHRPGATYLEVDVANGVSPDKLKDELAQELPDQLHVFTGEDFGEVLKASTVQAGALAIALQWVIILVAAVALSNTFTLSVMKRTRELAVLRAMGANRQFIVRLLLTEALAVGIVGAVLGLLIGFTTHWLANVVLSIATALDVHFTVSPFIALYVVGALVLCALGALPPAIAASRREITEAIADE